LVEKVIPPAVILVKKHSRETLPWGCSQARGSAPSAQDWADPAPGVCCLGSWPGARGRPQRPGLSALVPGVRHLS